ncbi:beta-adaptin-like protein A [Tanacetum coccineum]
MNLTELCEYAANVDIPIARESIRAVGKIALQQYDVNAIVDRLLQFLEMEKDYVTAETLVLVKDLLRKYPQWSHDCIAVIGNISSNNVQEPKAKAALIWMLGEYAQDMQDAPYALEGLIEDWEDETSPEVRLHLLTAVMKCFFRRPPETQKALGSALAAGLADMHQDVHDRALFYYRLLQHNVSVANSVVNPPKQAVSVFADTQSSEIKDRIFDEFNSLSVLYQKVKVRGKKHRFHEDKDHFGAHEGLVAAYCSENPMYGIFIPQAVYLVVPCYMFTDKEHQGPFAFSEEMVGNLSIGAEEPAADDNILPDQRVVKAYDEDLLLSTAEKEESRANNDSYEISLSQSHQGGNGDLLSLTQSPPQLAATLPIDDLFGLGLSIPSPPLKLNVKPTLDPGTFQQKWRQLPLSISQEGSITPQGVAALTTPQALLRHMQTHYIHCIASGGQAPSFKFFFFAQKADDEPSNFLVECLINSSTCKAQIKIKADDQSASHAFLDLFQSALSTFGIA